MPINPRLLIVEDIDATRERLQQLFDEPPAELSEDCVRIVFDVDAAKSGDEARRLLSLARDNHAPYGVLLLDIGLPESDDPSSKEDPNVGISILKSCQQEFRVVVNAVVIQSVHTEVPSFREYLQNGAADFVSKPYTKKQLYESVVRAYLTAVEKEWSRLNEKRDVEWGLVRSCRHVSDRLATTVSRATSELLSRIRSLAEILETEYGVVAGENGSRIDLAFREVRESARQVTLRCSESRFQIEPDSAGLDTVDLQEVAEEAVADLTPGIVKRNLQVRMHWPAETNVRGFKSGIRSICRELLFCSVEESPEHTEISVTCSSGDGVMNLIVKDESDSVDTDLLASISSLEEAEEEGKRYGRLFLMREVARNGACTLEVASHRETGNKFILQIPVTSHD